MSTFPVRCQHSSGADVSPLSLSLQQQQSPPPPPLTVEGNSGRGGVHPPSRHTSKGWQVDRPAVAALSSNPPSPPPEGRLGGVNLQCSIPGQQQKQQQQSGPPHLPSPTSHARRVQGGLTHGGIYGAAQRGEID